MESADGLSDEDREALAVYADAIATATTEEEREAIRRAIRELWDPSLLGNVVCPRCVRELDRCGCQDISPARDPSGHRWSGWPGAYCFYCGADSVVEACVGGAPGHEEHDIENPCPETPCRAPEAERLEIDRRMKSM